MGRRARLQPLGQPQKDDRALEALRVIQAGVRLGEDPDVTVARAVAALRGRT